MLLSEGQMSDDTAAALMIDHLPKAEVPLGDKGNDVEGFREAVAKRNIPPCITSKANRKIQIDSDKVLKNSVRKSKTCSVGSRTGDASTPAKMDSPTPSCPPSQSPQPSSSGLDLNESRA